MKKIVYPAIIGAFVFIFNAANAQESYNLIDQEGIILTGEKIDCEYNKGKDETLVVMSITNTGDKPAYVHYHLDLSYNGECATCSDPYGEYDRNFVLQPGQTIKGGCETDFKELNVFYGWAASKTQLLTDLSVSAVDIRHDSEESSNNQTTENGKHIISKSEFEELPQGKKDHILSNPDLYIIK